MDNRLNVVLIEPEIPQNTGNIARTCAVVGARLILVEPMGFRLSERNLKRSGCDYWDSVEVVRCPSAESFFNEHADDEMYLFTGRASRSFYEPRYGGAAKSHEENLPCESTAHDVYLIFGRESRGLDECWLARFADQCVRIPMRDGMRSLNLSNSVAIGVYEVVRQWNSLS